MFTDEQLKMIMQMPDFSGEEAVLARQGQMANSLRQYGRGGGNDTGSNIARALGGVGGAVADYYGAKGTIGLGDKRRAALQGIFGGGGGGGGAPVVNADISNY
jgi:hypothetical protein